jgi:hypothetical protein
MIKQRFLKIIRIKRFLLRKLTRKKEDKNNKNRTVFIT